MTQNKKTSSGNLYRIVSFDRAAEIITQKKLYFAHPSTWDDPYERALNSPSSKAIFAQCWCRKAVSDAMWRIYSPHGLGVRIGTTRSRLRKAIVSARTSRNISFAILDVDYLKQQELDSELKRIKSDLGRNLLPELSMEPLFLKRLAFDHERETRAIIYDEGSLQGETKKGISIDVDPFNLLTSIWIDPRAPDEIVHAYKHYLVDKLKFPGAVEKSTLYASPKELDD